MTQMKTVSSANLILSDSDVARRRKTLQWEVSKKEAQRVISIETLGM